MSWLKGESILGKGYKLTRQEGVRIKVKQTKGIRNMIIENTGTLNMKKRSEKPEVLKFFLLSTPSYPNLTMLKSWGPDSGGEDCSIFYLKLTGAVLIRKQR